MSVFVFNDNAECRKFDVSAIVSTIHALNLSIKAR